MQEIGGSCSSYLSRRAFFKKIAYSTCWEDFNTINNALKIEKNDKVISIASAGCNIFNALLKNPKKIIAIDFNVNQIHLLRLKIVAIKKLNHAQFLELFGIINSKQRKKIYQSIRNSLEEDTKIFWDNNIKLIKKGITYNGKQEKYIKLLGRFLRTIKDDELIENFMLSKSMKEQIDYFNKNIKGFIWNLFFKIVYSKPMMLFAKDKLVLNQIKDNGISKKFKNRVEKAIRTIPVYKNPFASIALLSRYYSEEFYPEYLKEKNFNILKKNINKIEIKTNTIIEELKKLKGNSYNKFNLSNVLDWVTNKEFEDTLNEIIRVSKNKGKLCYYNTLFNRQIPKKIKNIKPHINLSKKLLEKDRSFLYENFVVATISKEG